MTRKSVQQPARTTQVTFGDLVAALFDVAPNTEQALRLISPNSPLGATLRRRIVVVP